MNLIFFSVFLFICALQHCVKAPVYANYYSCCCEWPQYPHKHVHMILWVLHYTYRLVIIIKCQHNILHDFYLYFYLYYYLLFKISAVKCIFTTWYHFFNGTAQLVKALPSLKVGVRFPSINV